MKIFDLTTPEGLMKAINNPWLPIMSPSTMWFVEKIFGLFSNDDTVSEQRKTAIELIKTGKENGADEIKIVLNQTAGLNIKSELTEFPIKAQLGKSGDMTLIVKYK